VHPKDEPAVSIAVEMPASDANAGPSPPLFHQRRESVGVYRFRFVVGRWAGQSARIGGMEDHAAPRLMRRIDAARNMARFYALAIEPSLFGDVALVRCWGRIGTKGRSRVMLFADAEAARRQLARLIAAKERRGYRPVS
jgi:predicted DNA-binding WGR domain protein